MRKAILIAAMLALAGPVWAQGTAEDLTARLREVLPAQAAERVIATVAEARSRGLPARALEQRALMLARKGTDPASIARSVADQSRAMGEARAALARGRTGRPADDDVTAGAEVMRKEYDARGNVVVERRGQETYVATSYTESVSLAFGFYLREHLFEFEVRARVLTLK